MGSRLALIAACLAALAVGASAHAAGTRPQPLMVGAAEDAAREGGPLGADAKMSLASLAGFDTIRITSIWSPGELEVGGTELSLPPDRGRRGAAPRDPRDRLGLPVRRTDGAGDGGGARAVRLLRGVDPAPRAGRAVPDRRQRAEPEPLLDATVHPGRRRRGRWVVSRPARADLRRDQGRRARRDGDRRLGLAARRRQPAGGRGRPTPPPSSSATSVSPTGRAAEGGR